MCATSCRTLVVTPTVVTPTANASSSLSHLVEPDQGAKSERKDARERRDRPRGFARRSCSAWPPGFRPEPRLVLRSFAKIGLLAKVCANLNHSNSRRPRAEDIPTPAARLIIHASQPAIRRPRYSHVGSISPSFSSMKTVEPASVVNVHEYTEKFRNASRPANCPSAPVNTRPRSVACDEQIDRAAASNKGSDSL